MKQDYLLWLTASTNNYDLDNIEIIYLRLEICNNIEKHANCYQRYLSLCAILVLDIFKIARTYAGNIAIRSLTLISSLHSRLFTGSNKRNNDKEILFYGNYRFRKRLFCI
jgi:hypothetical protein